jgi:hypothetical protein
MRDSVNTTRLSAATLTDTDYRRMVDSLTDYAIIFLDPERPSSSAGTTARAAADAATTAPISSGATSRSSTRQEALSRGWPDHELAQAGIAGPLRGRGLAPAQGRHALLGQHRHHQPGGPRRHVRGFSKITRDLSERRQQEEHAARQRGALPAAGGGREGLRHLHARPAAATSPAGTCGAQKNKGWRPTEIIGQHFSTFYPPELPRAAGPARNWRTRCATAASRTRAGACARTARASGPAW